MQGNIVQILTLANWGNSYLRRGVDLQEAKFFPENPAFNFCKEVGFVDLDYIGDDDIRESDYAADPALWFAKLKEENVRRLLLRYERQSDSDRESVALIGGGGRWLIEAVSDYWSDFWEASWDIGDEADPEQKIWNVAYGRIAKLMPTQEFEAPSLEGLAYTTHAALEEIAEFAVEAKLNNFAECFEKGKEALRSEEPYKVCDCSDIALPEHFSLNARRLMSGIRAAWVFGGAGSWNDIAFEDQEEQMLLTRLSDELFYIFIQGLICAANSGFEDKR